jgi:hypothetical protein
MPVGRRPDSGDDPLVVEFADDRPVLDRGQPQRRMPRRWYAVRDVRRLPAVQEHDVAWQPEIAAWTVHPHHGRRARVVFAGEVGAPLRSSLSNERGSGER